MKTPFLRDISFWGVVAGNIAAIMVAVVQGWDLAEILWLYWAQSVIIGLTNFIRILTLKEFSTENFRINEKPVPETPAAKRQVAFFFLFHYGMFHFVYAMFLLQDMTLTGVDINKLVFLMLGALGFAGAHGFSLWRNAGRDFRDKKPNIGTIMFYPYMRILPMHLTVILGGMIGQGVLLVPFMLLKTVADAAMHAVEHHLFQKAGKPVAILRD